VRDDRSDRPIYSATVLTKGEIQLVQNDHGELVLSTRKTFQEIMGDELIAGVEQVLQRKVIAFLSANHIDPDIAVESFILAPPNSTRSNSRKSDWLRRRTALFCRPEFARRVP
jgi:uncharacterized protein YbcI